MEITWQYPRPDQGKLNPQFLVTMVFPLHQAPRETSWASPVLTQAMGDDGELGTTSAEYQTGEGSNKGVVCSKSHPGAGAVHLPQVIHSNSHCMHRAEFILHKEKGNCSFREEKNPKTTQNSSYLADTDLYTLTHTYIYILLANKERSDL